MTVRWWDVVRRPELGEAVFEVARRSASAVRAWAERQDVATASTRMVHSPSVDAWAILDGGITSIYGYGLTTLPAGVRIVGFQAYRLLLAESEVAGPDEPFPGEVPVDLDRLGRRHRSGLARDAAAVEQAELLAACTDEVMLRWVAATLLAGSTPAEVVWPRGASRGPMRSDR